jgi:hypothetical protein
MHGLVSPLLRRRELPTLRELLRVKEVMAVIELYEPPAQGDLPNELHIVVHL